jgi:hypothetical protein
MGMMNPVSGNTFRQPKQTKSVHHQGVKPQQTHGAKPGHASASTHTGKPSTHGHKPATPTSHASTHNDNAEKPTNKDSTQNSKGTTQSGKASGTQHADSVCNKKSSQQPTTANKPGTDAASQPAGDTMLSQVLAALMQLLSKLTSSDAGAATATQSAASPANAPANTATGNATPDNLFSFSNTGQGDQGALANAQTPASDVLDQGLFDIGTDTVSANGDGQTVANNENVASQNDDVEAKDKEEQANQQDSGMFISTSQVADSQRKIDKNFFLTDDRSKVALGVGQTRGGVTQLA